MMIASSLSLADFVHPIHITSFNITPMDSSVELMHGCVKQVRLTIDSTSSRRKYGNERPSQTNPPNTWASWYHRGTPIRKYRENTFWRAPPTFQPTSSPPHHKTP